MNSCVKCDAGFREPGDLCDGCKPKIFCPYCNKPLVIRCYYERSLDCEAEVSESGKLCFNEHEAIDFDDSDEFTDFECSECKENITKLVYEDIKELKKQYPEMFSPKGGEKK